MNNTLVTINILSNENGFPVLCNPSNVPIIYMSTSEDPWEELKNNDEFFEYLQNAEIINFQDNGFDYVENIKQYLETDICVATYTTDEFGQDVYAKKECSFQQFCDLYNPRVEKIKENIVRYCFDYLFDKAYHNEKDTSTGNVVIWWETLSNTFGDKLTKETLLNSIRAKLQSPKYDKNYKYLGNKFIDVTSEEAVIDYIKEQLEITE